MGKPFALHIVYADGNPRVISSHATLAEALAVESMTAHGSGHLFITDRDNEERGSLSELDLESCGGDYEG